MNVVVCLKQILDPEIPARDFRIESSSLEAARGSANLVTNIFCENALETALQFREQSGGGRISVLSFGAESAEDALRKALAMKADAATLVVNDGHAHPDSLTVARVLAAAVRKLGGADLVMVGREAGDWGAGQTGALLAEELQAPFVAFVDRIESDGDLLRIRRQTDSGWESFAVTPPVVVSITNDERNVPRVPKTRDVMMSYRQPLTRWTIDELGIDAAAARTGDDYFAVVDLSVPVQETNCEFVTGDSLEEKVERLAERMLQITRAL